jgi:hypothetical protein
MILKAMDVCPELRRIEELMDSVVRTIGDVLDRLEHAGVLAVSDNSEEICCNFAYGSPGAMPLICLIAENFPELRDKAFGVADKIGDFIWKEGLLKKGNGAFKGICGNAYALHCLYRTY